MERKWLERIMALILLVAVAINVTYTPAKDKPETKVIVIDPGHGGVDPGKVSAAGTLEKDINLLISKRLKKELEKRGYTVLLTRDDDYGLYQESDKRKKSADMRARTELINSSEAILTVSIHQNSFNDSSVKGSQVFYYSNSEKSKSLAGFIQKKLNLNTGGDRVEKANDSYYMLKNTQCPTVIVECGFLSNPEEEKLLKDKEYQKKLALAICDGVTAYAKVA